MNVDSVDEPCTRLQKEYMCGKRIVDHVDEQCARLKNDYMRPKHTVDLVDLMVQNLLLGLHLQKRALTT